jgi:hypothetical protein
MIALSVSEAAGGSCRSPPLPNMRFSLYCTFRTLSLGFHSNRGSPVCNQNCLLPFPPAPFAGGSDSSARDMSDQASAQGTGGSGGGSEPASGMASEGLQEQQVRVWCCFAGNETHLVGRVLGRSGSLHQTVTCPCLDCVH